MPTERIHDTQVRAADLYMRASMHSWKAIDQVFMPLLLFQWAVGIGLSLWYSPHTWVGTTPTTHIHLWLAIFGGAAISLPPVLLVYWYCGSTLSRHVVAISQVTWSALLIHLTGGRIETHFHVFGSLAFLAFYRDWRVMASAAAVTSLDHFIRGMWFPHSVYGIDVPDPWHWLEHTGWVLFEMVFLVYGGIRSTRDLKQICYRQAKLEYINAETEDLISKRTSQLQNAVSDLQTEAVHRISVEKDRESLTAKLVEASRVAGMAEIATGILHNVGNVLNSVNVSTELLSETISRIRHQGLHKSIELLDENEDDLGTFLNTEKGVALRKFLRQFAAELEKAKLVVGNELECLRKNVHHVTEVVNAQQSIARVGCLVESVTANQLIEDAICINEAALQRHKVNVDLDIQPLGEIRIDRHKVMQILINLCSNAKDAAIEARVERPTVAIRFYESDEHHVAFEIEDNGIGIDPANLTKIFSHGFTTKENGHGFGLHSAAIAANELGGSLVALSKGLGHGAVFRLTIPKVVEERVGQEVVTA